MKLDFSAKTMDVGTFEFQFVRTLMLAGTGAAEISECLQVMQLIRRNDAESWVVNWAAMAQRVLDTAHRAESNGHRHTARGAWFRASNYFRAAMMPLLHSDMRLDKYLVASRDCFQSALKLGPQAIDSVEIPFENARLPAYFFSAGSRNRPTLVVLNGGDSTNEEMAHWYGFAAVDRGWNCLIFEGPGQWSALQLNPGLLLRHDYEQPVAAVIDYLVQRQEVDPSKIALLGPSLGSLFAARVAALEPRICACICDGLVVDLYEAWHAVWPRLLQNAPARIFNLAFTQFERMSPQLRGLANHFRWIFGKDQPFEIIEAMKPYNLIGLAPKINCPVLVTYGEAELAQTDERVALSALRFLRDLRSPLTLRLFGFEDGWAASHCRVGALAPMQAVVFAWLDKVVVEAAKLPAHEFDLESRASLTKYFRSPKAKKELGNFLRAMEDCAPNP